MNTRRTTLLVAIILALGTGLLTLNYVSSLSARGPGAPRDILIAAQDIPPRVVIVAAMLRHSVRPTSEVDPDAVTDPKLAVGALSLITIPAGSSITTSKIGHPSDIGLPVRLQRGMRAVSISIDKVKGVSGLLEPGDRVDVIAVPPRQSNETPQAATILRGVRVLALGISLEYSSATPSPEEQNSTTVTLELTPKQADLVAMADVNAVLRLALRSPKESIRSAPVEPLHFQQAEVAQAAPAPLPAPLPAIAAPLPVPQPQRAVAPARQSQSSGVEIIDGDRVGNSTGNTTGP